ncbi:MAG: tetratricopeptide repeat protein [Pyrinomonadaceae bacterium]
MDDNIEEIKALFREATRLRDTGDLAGAVERLEKALTLEPSRRAPILGVLAHVYFLSENFEKARICYKEATELSPSSELGSLGYFLTLRKLERYQEAFEEAERFLSKNDSKDYILAIEEIVEDFRRWQEQRGNRP